jgi:hypothetical protein
VKRITVWKRFDNVVRRFEHNHIEDGWTPAEQHVPVSKFPDVNKDWKNGLWVRFHAYMDARGKVIE